MNLKAQPGGYLLLEDGSKFTGDTFFGNGPALAEAVFNTSHTGYQEIISDPSYYRQLVVFTAPHIGNVGINREDIESVNHRAAGVVVRSLPANPRNWRATDGLGQWLLEQEIPILVGANTRGITLRLRDHGAMRAGIFPPDFDEREALKMITASIPMEGADLASLVSCDTPYQFDKTAIDPAWHPFSNHGDRLRVAVLDFGVKLNILRELASRGCELTVLPAKTKAEQIIAGNYDGLMLSNGPGDPASVTYAIETIRSLLKTELPIFGICLGHQLLSLAAGGDTFKLPFGHRGSNHPVRCEDDQTIEITSQNHGFAVKPERFGSDWHVTHVNLNDHTIEGLRHATRPIFSIQYHPEASPGPHEGHTYFDQFIKGMHHAKA